MTKSTSDGPDGEARTVALTERGRRTQRAIMNAAYDLIASGRSFNSLSLREVATGAGVVPTAFYRHFKDMNELGLALVDDCGRTLREQLRRTRSASLSSQDIIRSSFLVLRNYVRAHPRSFYIASGERHGGSPLLRDAVRAEIERFVDEMAQDIAALQLLPRMSDRTLRNVCDLVVNIMLTAASEIMDWPPEDRKFSKLRTEAYIQQLRIIFLGADVWVDKSVATQAERL